MFLELVLLPKLEKNDSRKKNCRETTPPSSVINSLRVRVAYEQQALGVRGPACTDSVIFGGSLLRDLGVLGVIC